MRKVPLAENVEASKIARGTPGFSGADLANLVNEAALFAARAGVRSVGMQQFELAKDKIMMGAERRSMVMSEKEKLNTAESVFVSEMFSNLSTSFFLATFFVLAFSFFFLGIRPGIIVTAILPFTVGLVLFGCNLIGLPLHQTSITGIIIALGLLIDNGIIVVEDYKYRRSKGLLPAESIKESVNHLFARRGWFFCA